MPVTIPDETVREAGVSERDMLIEIACRLFDADKLSKPAASRLAGLSRIEFENELVSRSLPIIHIDEEYMRQELHSLEQLRRDRSEG
jgi:predicted HTH domain antitoxin